MGLVFAAMALAVLAGTAPSAAVPAGTQAEARAATGLPAAPAPAAPPTPRTQPPSIAQALESGTLIVISKASQRMDVFKDGQPCLSSPVSTGRRGHATPAGVFPILEKQRFHRSNIYSNAPMPFMQRLTRGGIAIHAGYVPGHPASHGCIRLPYAMARTLFGLTRAGDATVVIVNAPMQSDAQALRLAQAMQPPLPGQPVPAAMASAAAPPPVAPARPGPGGQTIQLAAAMSPGEADAQWTWLLSLHAELARLDKAVVPVMVGSHRLFRLRASGPGAFGYCAQLRGAGIDCFRVL
jgi:lipoprotein-anchoring transpeptidase ErfK/SrfK